MSPAARGARLKPTFSRLIFAVKGLDVIKSVWPSGAARATTCVPILPLAPGLFSTTTGWFQRRWISSPMLRARMSGPVPGVNGTTMVMVRPAVCADAASGSAKAAASASAPRSVHRRIVQVVMAPLLAEPFRRQMLPPQSSVRKNKKPGITAGLL
jgi:hypothetical protein